MTLSEKDKNTLSALQQKLETIGQDTSTHLEGLLWSKPMTYWDYIQTDALLNLQVQRTVLPDEMVFIGYHQINELIFKLVLWEMAQVAEAKELTVAFFKEKLNRLTRYFDMLTTSFNIMKDGMTVEQYMKFRTTLTPGSGFQSAQYRLIEFGSTDIINLIDARYREDLRNERNPEIRFENLYWQAAGKDHRTGEKSFLLKEFEKKYKRHFLSFVADYQQKNLWSRYKELTSEEQKDENLLTSMRHYDKTVNIQWVMAHYHAAEHFLDSGKIPVEATGGSHWKKYMHPRFQKRIFFPDLWTREELNNWGNE